MGGLGAGGCRPGRNGGGVLDGTSSMPTSSLGMQVPQEWERSQDRPGRGSGGASGGRWGQGGDSSGPPSPATSSRWPDYITLPGPFTLPGRAGLALASPWVA